MTQQPAEQAILVLDPDPKNWRDFYDALSTKGAVRFYPTLEALLSEQRQFDDAIVLLDIDALKKTPTALTAEIVERRRQLKAGLISNQKEEDYLFDLRRWGILQVAIKAPPVEKDDVAVFIDSIVDPLCAFGLFRYLSHTVEMYHLSISTLPEKTAAIERVINHFATCGFDIHELYDVRLILEELTNNAIFHAFRDPKGVEKYSIRTFTQLAPDEQVQVEYGSSNRVVGFSVTDNAGSLNVGTILSKLERQYNRDGIFEESGRGLYLSRMLATSLIVNIEEKKRTQLVALFDDRRKLDRPKAFMINCVGDDCFDQWGLDSELD